MKKFEIPIEALIVLIPLFAALFITSHLTSTTETSIVTQTTVTQTTTTLEATKRTQPKVQWKQSATIKVPAVDNEGKGVVTMLKVDVMPGEGRILVNINQLLFWVDTQYSIQSAKMVAQNVTGMDLTSLDIVYTIETNASLIEGPSAGAALTVATVAVLENKTINDSVMITGTISRSGLIGPVGGVIAKAKAAKDIGAKLFLVPSGQATQTYYEPKRSCRQIGPVTYCTTNYVEKRIDVAKDVGIEVKEVSNINEALKYFLI